MSPLLAAADLGGDVGALEAWVALEVRLCRQVSSRPQSAAVTRRHQCVDYSICLSHYGRLIWATLLELHC